MGAGADGAHLAGLLTPGIGGGCKSDVRALLFRFSPFRVDRREEDVKEDALSSACVRHRSPTKTSAKTKCVKLVSPTTERELLPQQLCYCLGSGHLRGVKGHVDYASRRDECRDCRRPEQVC